MPLIVAHRGRTNAGYRENAMSGFRASIAQGVRVLELDLHASKDNTLWVMHDETLDRTTSGTGKISELCDLEIAKLRLTDEDGDVSAESLPRFTDVLELAAQTPELMLMLDLKPVGAAAVVSQLNAYGLTSRAILLTFTRKDAETALACCGEAMVSVLVSTQNDLDWYEEHYGAHRLAFYVPQHAPLGLFATAHKTQKPIVSDAVMEVVGGPLDARAASAGDAIYSAFLNDRHVDFFVTDRATSVQKAIREENNDTPALLTIENLSIAFSGTKAVRGISLEIRRGEAVGFVGESGCGKSVTWLAAMGLLPNSAKVDGTIRLEEQNLISAPKRQLERVRGKRIAMIFQDASSSLDPVMRVGQQIAEAVTLHTGLVGQAAKIEALRLMEIVGIPDRENRYTLYPHEFSGGQCQRLMIAIALAGKPDLLIADEPTTALDATIQAQILDLLNRLRAETGMALVFISHDLGAVSQVCDRICVMYAGKVVEQGPVEALFSHPLHPYTLGLFQSIPDIDGEAEDLATIPGAVPDPRDFPIGCAFASRCTQSSAQCEEADPVLKGDAERAVACWHAKLTQGVEVHS